MTSQQTEPLYKQIIPHERENLFDGTDALKIVELDSLQQEIEQTLSQLTSTIIDAIQDGYGILLEPPQLLKILADVKQRGC